MNKALAVSWQTPQTTSAWKGIWGQRDDDAIYLGQWSWHVSGNNWPPSRNHNRLVGINFKGIYGATFINSHGARSYTLGLQRIVLSQKFENHLQFDLGYRLGVVWGYTSETNPLGQLKSILPGIENINPVPAIQFISNISWEMVGVQFSYCFVVVTVGFFIKI